MNGITLTALLNKIETTRDGGWIIRFEVGQDEKEQILALSEHRTGLLQLGIVPVGQSHPIKDEISWDDVKEQADNRT